MNQQTMRNLTLFDLLARSWELPSAVEALRFSADGSVVAFACEDGSVAIARLADPEPPEARIRVSGDLGQATIRPREKPPAPLTVINPLSSKAPILAAYGRSDFLAGCTDGKVFRLTSDGEVSDTEIDPGGAIVALDYAPKTGITAISDGADVFLSSELGKARKLGRGEGGEIVALAFSPDGNALAVSSADGVSVWLIGDDIALRRTIALPGQALSANFSADGQWLACPLASGGFALADLDSGKVGTVMDFPTLVRSVSWSEPGNALVTSGAFRIAGWSMQAPPLEGRTEGALVTGRAGLVIVERVAAHPQKPLAAAAYANGQIVVAQIGARDELLVKPAGGVVNALAWSADGRHLATAGVDGSVSLIAFPAQMFK